MRAIIVLLALIGVGLVYQFGGSQLDEDRVRAFYERSDQAYRDLDDKALCEMLADDFSQSALYVIEGEQERVEQDKQGACDATAESMEQLRRIQQAMRGRSPVDFQQTIVSITVAENGRSALVVTRGTLAVPGMRMSLRSRDTVERRRWYMRITRSEGTVWLGPAYR